jgi:hypothetical protein
MSRANVRNLCPADIEKYQVPLRAPALSHLQALFFVQRFAIETFRLTSIERTARAET